MGLDKATLKTGVKNLHNELYANAANLTPAQAADRYAEGMSDLFDAFVKSGDGVYQTGTLTAGATLVTKVPPGTSPSIKIQ